MVTVTDYTGVWNKNTFISLKHRSRVWRSSDVKSMLFIINGLQHEIKLVMIAVTFASVIQRDNNNAFDSL